MKLTREALGITLAEALNRIDKYLDSNPGVRKMHLQIQGKSHPYVALLFKIGFIFFVIGVAGKLLASG